MPRRAACRIFPLELCALNSVHPQAPIQQPEQEPPVPHSSVASPQRLRPRIRCPFPAARTASPVQPARRDAREKQVQERSAARQSPMQKQVAQRWSTPLERPTLLPLVQQGRSPALATKWLPTAAVAVSRAARSLAFSEVAREWAEPARAPPETVPKLAPHFQQVLPRELDQQRARSHWSLSLEWFFLRSLLPRPQRSSTRCRKSLLLAVVSAFPLSTVPSRRASVSGRLCLPPTLHRNQ